MTIRIETNRLVLRPPESHDVDMHIAMMQAPAVAATLSPSKQPQRRDDLWRQFAGILGHWQIRGYGFFSVEEKATGAWIGRVGPWMPEGWPGIECGWTIHPDHWGKGYAPEAAIASVLWTFRKLPDLKRIISVIDPDNVNSQAVAKKIGEEKSGEVFEYKDYRLDIWAAGREGWLERFGE